MRYQVTIDKPVSCALLDLKGSQQDLSTWSMTKALQFPSSRNMYVNDGPLTVCWIGPDHWLLKTELAQEKLLESMASANDLPDAISAVLISDAISFFGIKGPDADQVLSIASPLDVHPSVFPESGVTYTEAFGLKALVIRCAGGFEFAIERSYADMIEDYFRRAVDD